MSIQESKNELRSQIRTKLANISPAVRAVESVGLCERLKAQMQSANKILFFAPLADELDIWPVLELSMALGCTCALPFFDAEKKSYRARVLKSLATEIVTGKFGVREPAATCAEMPLDTFDLVLVPGMAFDSRGNRLGRGQGFYDRLLAAASGIKCGVGYDFQLVPEVPAEPHDAKVDFIFTPSWAMKRKS